MGRPATSRRTTHRRAGVVDRSAGGGLGPDHGPSGTAPLGPARTGPVLPTPSWKLVAEVPWWAWSGGLFGGAFILLAILLLPTLGAATLFALVIAGQVLAAITLDHFGALGLTPHPISTARLAGAVLLIAGVALMRD